MLSQPDGWQFEPTTLLNKELQSNLAYHTSNLGQLRWNTAYASKNYYDIDVSLTGNPTGLEFLHSQKVTDLFKAHVGNWLPPDRNTPGLDGSCGDGKFLFTIEQMGYNDLRGAVLGPKQRALAVQWDPGPRIIQGDVGEFL
jgi:hypothetical protein